MTNKILYITLGIFLVGLNAVSQQTSRVHGRLIDAQNKSGMVGTSIQLISVRT